jgi:ribonuclease HII
MSAPWPDAVLSSEPPAVEQTSSWPPAPPRVLVRREAGLYAYQQALARAGLAPVAGADEAGRGACAGPLVAAAVILPEGRRGQIDELNDSKLLTPAARERCYARIVDAALAWSVVISSPQDCDRLGMHRVNVEALRRSLRRLEVRPAYVLTDGFGVDGVGVDGLAVWKGDRVAACIAAASVLAKVTRDRIMVRLHDLYPQYDFATHKGYCTPEHGEAMRRYGPSPVHRMKWDNVIAASLAHEAARVRLSGRPVTDQATPDLASVPDYWLDDEPVSTGVPVTESR